jgi:hypothetical protein
MKYIKKWTLFEKFNSIDEYIYYVTDNLKKYNIFQSEMNDLLNRYHDEIQASYDDGRQPFQVAQKIAKDLELDSGGLMQYKMGSINRFQEIKYL